MYKKAFTLAEVLITLTIIGVIAALTIPNLMQKWSDHADIQKVKEAYSILSNAIKMAIAENGPIDSWGLRDYYAGSVDFGQKIKPYLKVAEDCSQNQKGNCFNYGYNSDGSICTPSKNTPCGNYLSLTNTVKSATHFNPSQNVMRFKLVNNMRIGMRTTWSNGKMGAYPWIFLDINGEKGPNKAGYDIFVFGLNNEKGLTPLPELWNMNNTNIPKWCSSIQEDDAQQSGMTCYYWILKHNNMDYKYRDVSAEW